MTCLSRIEAEGVCAAVAADKQQEHEQGRRKRRISGFEECCGVRVNRCTNEPWRLRKGPRVSSWWWCSRGYVCKVFGCQEHTLTQPGWLTDSLICCIISWFAESSWLTVYLTGLLASGMSGWLADSYTDWLADWEIGLLADRLVDWLADWMNDCMLSLSTWILTALHCSN